MNKKTIYIVLILSILSLSACGNKAEKNEIPGVTPLYNPEKDLEEDARYHIDRIDASIKSSRGSIVGDCYYDKVIFDVDEYAKCNAILEKKAEEFMRDSIEFKEMVESIGKESDYMTGYFPYTNAMSVMHIEFAADFVSIRMQRDWYAGGVVESNISAINLNKNGEEINIADVLGMPEDECLKLVYSTTINFLKENELYDEIADQYLQEYQLSNYNFYLENNKCYLCFGRGEIAYGAAGSFAIELSDF